MRELGERAHRESRRTIQTRADGGPAERDLRERVTRSREPLARQLDLPRPARELLAQTHGRRVHEVSPAELHHVVECGGFLSETLLEPGERRREVVPQREPRG